jgi:hypothetical protein
MRRAAVDQRGKDLILSSYSLTSAGFFILNDTMRRATSDIDVDRLGALVQQMLNASERLVETPSPADYPLASERHRFKLAGVRSRKAYHENCVSVYVDEANEEDSLVVVPTHNLGSRAGFEALPDLSLTVRSGGPPALGRAVRECLARAR